MNGGESGGQAARGVNANAGSIPGQAMVKQASAGQGARVAANAPFHSGCGQYFHSIFRLIISPFGGGGPSLFENGPFDLDDAERL